MELCIFLGKYLFSDTGYKFKIDFGVPVQGLR